MLQNFRAEVKNIHSASCEQLATAVNEPLDFRSLPSVKVGFDKIFTDFSVFRLANLRK